jgi:hypothetical protein
MAVLVLKKGVNARPMDSDGSRVSSCLGLPKFVCPVVLLGMPGDAFMYGTLVTGVDEAGLS